MDSNPGSSNPYTNVYFLNAKITGSDTGGENPYSTIPQPAQSSTGGQGPVFLAASSAFGPGATSPQLQYVPGSQVPGFLNVHRVTGPCSTLPQTPNSAGELPGQLNVQNYSGPFATLPQNLIQNLAGNNPVLLNPHSLVRQDPQPQNGAGPVSMLPMVDPSGMGGWYSAMNIVRTRMKESELQNMVNWPILPRTEEVLGASPSKPAKSAPASEPSESETSDVDETSEKSDARGGDSLSAKVVRRFKKWSALLILFSILTIAGGVAGVVLYFLRGQYGIQNFPDNPLQLSKSFTDVFPPSLDYLWSGVGILAILVLITGILGNYVKTATSKTTRAFMVFCFLSLIVTLAMMFFSALDILLTIGKDSSGNDVLMWQLLIVSAAVGLLSMIEFFMTFIALIYLCHVLKKIRKQNERESQKGKDNKKGKQDASESESESGSESETEQVKKPAAPTPAPPPAIQRPAVPYMYPGYSGLAGYPGNRNANEKAMYGQYHPYGYVGTAAFNPMRIQ